MPPLPSGDTTSYEPRRAPGRRVTGEVACANPWIVREGLPHTGGCYTLDRLVDELGSETGDSETGCRKIDGSDNQPTLTAGDGGGRRRRAGAYAMGGCRLPNPVACSNA